ncbi:MAG: hypothetical protein JXP37_09855, partial [Coriobacteriia bacterium]|nr:hypothetical protein [Coriobacteriia bacterium]
DYAITQVTFHRPNGDQTVTLTATQGTYTITAAPYLSMTITTPDDGQSVDFGAIDPDVTTPAKTVTVQVTSSAAYTITRTIEGDAALLGFDVTGTASGAGSAGTATYADEYTLTPPWTTEPDVPLVATVTYTVTQ